MHPPLPPLLTLLLLVTSTTSIPPPLSPPQQQNPPQNENLTVGPPTEPYCWVPPFCAPTTAFDCANSLANIRELDYYTEPAIWQRGTILLSPNNSNLTPTTHPSPALALGKIGKPVREVPITFKYKTCFITLDVYPYYNADEFTLEEVDAGVVDATRKCVKEAKAREFALGGRVGVGNGKGFFWDVEGDRSGGWGDGGGCVRLG